MKLKIMIACILFTSMLIPVVDYYLNKASSPIHIKIEPHFKNVCYNHKDLSKESNLIKLKEFIKGPCSPLVVAPGVFASRIRVEIDCEELKDKHPEIFYDDCYWNSCEKDFWPFYRKPRKEYDIYISFFGHLGPITNKIFNSKCLNKLGRNYYDTKSEKAKTSDMLIDLEGARVTYYGDTNETRYTSNCNLDSVYDLLGYGGKLSMKTADMKNFFDMLTEMGYISGLTMGVLAYDWRIDAQINEEVRLRMNKTIRKMKNITGKKVNVVAHSYGNVIAVASFKLHFSQEEKDYYINNLVAIYPPSMGTNKAAETMIGGYYWDEMFELVYGYWSSMVLSSYATSILGGLVNNVYEVEKDEAWMKNVTKHILHEKSFLEDNEVIEKGISFWPSANETCSSNIGPKENDYCVTRLFNQSDTFAVKIKGKEYKPKHVRKLVESLGSYMEDIDKLYAIYDRPENKKQQEPDNLGFPMILIFNVRLPTKDAMIYNNTPHEHRKDNQVYTPDRYIYRSGDGSIPNTSQLTLALKWALQYDLEKHTKKHYKPIKFVEYCSMFQKKISPFDDDLIDSQSDNLNEEENIFEEGLYKKNFLSKSQFLNQTESQLKIKENGYIGLPCKCLDNSGTKTNRTSGEKCNHTNTFSDEYLIHFIANTLVDYQKSTHFMGSASNSSSFIANKNLDDFLKSYFNNENDLKSFIKRCDLQYKE